MVFADYAITLKGHFKRIISNENLCEMLFDSIIKPLDLRNRKGEVLTFDKADISKIMNRKKNLPNILQNHVHNKVVRENMEEYFKTQIVPELFDDTSDLRCQMMNLIETDKNISSEQRKIAPLSQSRVCLLVFGGGVCLCR